MPRMIQTCEGACHCGAVRVSLALSKAAAEQRVRACQCGFCRPRGVRTIADNAGLARIGATAPHQLVRYRFGLRTADYLLCRTCGTYIGAVQDDGDRSIAVINVGGLAVAEFATRDGDPVSYGGEVAQARLARRRTYWMPVEIGYLEPGPPAGAIA